MKKFLCLFSIFIFLIILGGCSDKKEKLTITPFTCEVRMLSGESVNEGVFVFENKNSMYLDLASDAERLRIRYGEGICSYSLGDISVTVPSETDSFQAYGLFSAIRLLDASRVEIVPNKENVFCLVNKNEEYTYTVDGESGKLLKVSSINGEITFRYQD